MINFRQISDERNRGILFDITTFILSIFLMRILASFFIQLVRRIETDQIAAFAVGIFLAGLLFLNPIGAILKRRNYHKRKLIEGGEELNLGCLFHPAIYLTLMLVIYSFAAAILGEAVFGKNFDNKSGIFAAVLFGGIILCIANTIFVYRFFTRPKREPYFELMKSPQIALLGDACVLLNMLCFQMLWSILLSAPLKAPRDMQEFLGRMFVVSFAALLVYFPSRMLILAEDFRRSAAWFSMFLANLPIILRIVFGW
jgi:hypothetical protein